MLYSSLPNKNTNRNRDFQFKKYRRKTFSLSWIDRAVYNFIPYDPELSLYCQRKLAGILGRMDHLKEAGITITRDKIRTAIDRLFRYGLVEIAIVGNQRRLIKNDYRDINDLAPFQDLNLNKTYIKTAIKSPNIDDQGLKAYIKTVKKSPSSLAQVTGDRKRKKKVGPEDLNDHIDIVDDQIDHDHIEIGYLIDNLFPGLSRLEMIEVYLDSGLDITPLDPQLKKPFHGWTKKKLAKQTRESLLEFFDEHPDCGVGMWMRNLTAYDFDRHRDRWPTLRVKTQHDGVHNYFLLDPDLGGHPKPAMRGHLKTGQENSR
jgi:hypothetical protein